MNPAVILTPPRWTPQALSGLVSLYDWTSVLWGEAGRTTHPSADGDRVLWWDDVKAGKNVRAGLDAERTYLRPTGGPATGKRGIQWDGTNAATLFYATGSELVAGSAFTMVAVFNPTAAGATSGIMGRGGYNGNGSFLRMNATNQLVGMITTAGGATSLTEPTATTGVYKVAGLTYDGANMHLAVRGKATQSSAKTGATSFHASDTAFWLGATTGNGSAYAWREAKHIALAFVTTNTYDATGLTNLLNQVAAYSGVA